MHIRENTCVIELKNIIFTLYHFHQWFFSDFDTHFTLKYGLIRYTDTIITQEHH